MLVCVLLFLLWGSYGPEQGNTVSCPLSATSCSSNIIKHVLTQVHHVLFSEPGQQTLKG